ncbi:maltose permease [Atractiella rhizophila]|nr:maltose permease [Atractiella rhizophila]
MASDSVRSPSLTIEEQPGAITTRKFDEVVAHISDSKNVVHDAAEADAAEHRMTLREGFRVHKKAIFWSMALSAALIMEGYDVVVVRDSFHLNSTSESRHRLRLSMAKTGSWLVLEEVASDGTRYIPAQWQSALSNGAPVGGILGLALNGWAAERFGARKVMLTALVFLTGFIFIFVFAESLTTLVIAEVFSGIPWGIFQVLTTAYASEVCPIQLRGYLTTYINLCWGVGILLSSGIVRATATIDSDWSWRLPFVLQWVWPVPLMFICYYAPESPWWLVRQGRLEDAEKSLKRLSNAKYFTEQDAKNSVAMMVYTTELEKQQTAGATYLDCFRGIDARRTEIAMLVFAIQLLSGENLIGQAVQFFRRAGLGEIAALDLNIGLNSMFIIGTIVSWGLITRWGRRTLYIAGLVAMCVVLFIIGGLGFSNSDSAGWASGSLLIALNLAYNSTLGPICYALIAEVGSTHLRQKTVALARIAYQLMNIICGIIVPRQLSPADWNWGPKAGFFWAGSCIFCIIWCFFRLPETRGRSYAELDILFENKVPAWKFSKTQVDQFHIHEKKRADEKEDLKEDLKTDLKEDPDTKY